MGTSSITTSLPLRQDTSDQHVSPLVPLRTAMPPRLGNFSSIFDQCFPAPTTVDETSTFGSADPVKPAKFLQSSGHPTGHDAKKSSPISFTPSPRAPVYSEGFLSGLDLSTIGSIDSPSGTPLSLIQDNVSEDDDGSSQDEEPLPVGGHNRVIINQLPSKQSLFSTGTNVEIASASTSPVTTLAASTAKAISTINASTPRGVTAVSWSPKRASGFASMNASPAPVRSDLPYSLNQAPTSSIAPSIWSAWINHPIQPLSWLTKKEKLDLLEKKLKYEYKRDRALTASSAASPIHVFVDLSNIVIGFYERIKVERMMAGRMMSAMPFFFEAFTQILVRGRTSERLVTAGSVQDPGNWPKYMRDAEALGYEMNILSRVSKLAASPKLRPSNKKNNAFQGHKKSPSRGNNDGQFYSDVYSSDDALGPSSPAPPAVLKNGEQAVDEILHLKICHSVLDYEPGTIVLATGDAAEAEFSDGFLKHVERALDRGWCVELLSWKTGISNAWRELERDRKRSGQFRIIELDKYVEDLLGMYVE